MFKNLIKIVLVACFLSFSFFQNAFSSSQTGEVDLAIKNFLVNHPTLFYTNIEKDDLYNNINRENNNFEILSGFYLCDINSDKIPEILLNVQFFERSATYIYTYDEYDKTYVLLSIIDSSSTFYKDGKGRITLFEGSEHYSDGVKYSYIFFDNNKFEKMTMYYNGEEYFNKLNAKTYNNSDLLKDNSILDKSIKALPKINADGIYAEASKIVRKNLDSKNKKISILLNNKILNLSIDPVIISSKTMVPLRSIADNFGAKTDWNDKEKSITITLNDIKLVMYINNKVASINSTKKTLEVAPTLVNEKTMVPMRFIIEALGGDVSWIDSTKTASIIYYPPNYIETDYFNDFYVATWSNEITTNFKNIYNFKDISNSEKFAIWSNRTITNIEIVTLDYVNNNLVEKKSIYKLDKLTPLDLLVIDIVVSEGIPNQKVKYIDEFGKPSSFIFYYDGR